MAAKRLTYAIACGLALCGAPPAGAAILDPAFTEASWISVGPNGITGLAWAPDGSGRLFVAMQQGVIRIVRWGSPPTLLPTPFATVSPILVVGECGLLGIAFDPGFIENGYVYVFVTVSTSEQQIIRYTAVGDIGTDKTVVIPGLPTLGANHDGGAVGFGPDGRLYWGIGDLGNWSGANADLTSLASKVGRANAEGTVPATNPFVDGPGPNNDFVWARGFRNPFTFTFQPATGALWVNVAGNVYEQIFTVSAGDHAGWNDYENNQPTGFLPPAIKYRTNSTDTLSIAPAGAVRAASVATYSTTAAHGLRQGEKVTIQGVANGSFDGSFFVASVPDDSSFRVSQPGPDASSGGGTVTTLAQGGAVTGGAFYDATAFPASHRGNFFYGDFNSGRIMRATVGPGTSVTSVDYWTTGPGNQIDVTVGPDGALYYAHYNGNIFRATYNATEQGLVVSNAHLDMGEGRAAAFTVRLALAPSSDVSVAVARSAGSPDVSVSQGSSLTFTPSSWESFQTVVLSAAEDADLDDSGATITVSSIGLPPESVAVRVHDSSGPYGDNPPGRVPDGADVAGIPLTLARSSSSPGSLELSWGAACGFSATDYTVHEGSVGVWYSHRAVACTTAGAAAATIVPGAGNRYYLVVPTSTLREGSYGTDSTGAERPRSTARCRSERDTTPCP